MIQPRNREAYYLEEHRALYGSIYGSSYFPSQVSRLPMFYTHPGYHGSLLPYYDVFMRAMVRNYPSCRLEAIYQQGEQMPREIRINY